MKILSSITSAARIILLPTDQTACVEGYQYMYFKQVLGVRLLMYESRWGVIYDMVNHFRDGSRLDSRDGRVKVGLEET